MHDHLVNTASKSEHGRGGMAAKIGAAWMAAQHGCTTVILNGKKPDGILQARPASCLVAVRRTSLLSPSSPVCAASVTEGSGVCRTSRKHRPRLWLLPG